MCWTVCVVVSEVQWNFPFQASHYTLYVCVCASQDSLWQRKVVTLASTPLSSASCNNALLHRHHLIWKYGFHPRWSSLNLNCWSVKSAQMATSKEAFLWGIKLWYRRSWYFERETYSCPPFMLVPVTRGQHCTHWNKSTQWRAHVKSSASSSWFLSLMWINRLHSSKGWQAREGSRAPNWEGLGGVAMWLLLSPLSVVSKCLTTVSVFPTFTLL